MRFWIKNNRPFGRLILGKRNNFVRCTMEDGAQLLQSVHCNGFVTLQVCDCISAETVLINQRVGGNTAGFHCFPQRLIADHICTIPFLPDAYIIL